MKRFDASLKATRPAEEGPAVRFETAPGKQMQVDFVMFRRSQAPLSAFVATLGYSHLSFVCFVAREDFESVVRVHAGRSNARWIGGKLSLRMAAPVTVCTAPSALPVESLQHPWSVYADLLAVA